MYIIKIPNIIKFKYGNNIKIAKQVGLTAEHLSRILNGKEPTKYTTAYCIVKLYDNQKEVLDFFNKKY